MCSPFPSCRRPGRATACWGPGDLRPGGAGGGDGAGQAPAHHLAHLVVHGVSHLLGYDHMNGGGGGAHGAPGTQDPSGAGHPDPYRDEPPRAPPTRHRFPEMGAWSSPMERARPFLGLPLAHPRASALIAGALTVLAFAPFDLFWLPPDPGPCGPS